MNFDRLIDAFKNVIQGPLADPRRTALAIGVVIAAILVIGIIVLILLPPEEEDDEEHWDDDTQEVEPPSRLRLWATLSAILVVVLFVVVGLLWVDHWSRMSGTCAQCHVLDASVQTWRDGSHADVDCTTCHDSPGRLGLVDTRVRAFSDVVANLSAPTSVRAPATTTEGGCRSCHSDQLNETLVVGSVRVRHAEFARSLSCQQCHGRVGHQGLGAKEGALSSGVMTTCSDCHDGKVASNACSTCHVGDIALVGGSANSFAKIELDAPKNCKGCHSLDRCTACHGLVMPHPEGWADPKQHAKYGAFDTTVCVRCHGNTSSGCAPCHGSIHSSHLPTWKTEHQKAQASQCSPGCHDPEKVGPDMCALCHSKSG